MPVRPRKLQRILLISNALSPIGGAEERITHLAVTLAGLGVRTTLLVSDPVSMPNGYRARLRAAGVRVVSACAWAPRAARGLALIAWPLSAPVRRAFSRRFPEAARDGAFASLESTVLWTAIQCMRKHLFGVAACIASLALRPQVVHAFKPSEPSADAVRAAKRLGIPVVYSETGEAVPELSDYTPRVLRSAPRADVILVTSHTVARNARALYGCADKVMVVPPLLPRMAAVPPKPVRDRVTLGYAGRITDEKNLHGLLEALGRLDSGVADWRLIVAGAGWDLPRCRETTRRLGLADRVEFRGPYADSAAWGRFVEETDLFVLPSKSEGFPVVLVEMAAASRPVLAASVGGVAEAVIEGRTGFLARGADPTSLAAALEKALQDPGQLAEMGKRAREFYEDRFLPEAVLPKMLGLYEALLAHRVLRSAQEAASA